MVLLSALLVCHMLDPQQQSSETRMPQQTLCGHRWHYLIVNLQTGMSRTCCLTPKRTISNADIEKYGSDVFLNTDYLKDRRKEMLTGVRHSDCNACWKLEDQGVKSKRTDFHSLVHHFRARKLLPSTFRVREVDELWNKTLSQQDLLKENCPRIIEINRGSQCDLKCTYCNHWYSSQWRQEKEQWGDLTEDDKASAFPTPPDNFENTFWSFLAQSSKTELTQINIIGGEPLMSPRLDKILLKLKEILGEESSHRKLEIGIVSNFNARPAKFQRFLEVVKELGTSFRVHIQPSMESVGSRAEYIRQNLSWDRFQNNVHELLNRRDELGLHRDNFYFSLMPALNALSVSSLPEFLEYSYDLTMKYDLPIGIGSNVVTDPAHHDPTLLTPDFAKYTERSLELASKMTETQNRLGRHPYDIGNCGCWESIVETLHSTLLERDYEFNDKQRQFLEFIQTNDHRRGLNFLSTFPEYQAFVEHCRKGYMKGLSPN